VSADSVNVEVRRDVVETDVAVVGAGPAGLACAAHLAAEVKRRGAADVSIMVFEKSGAPGTHVLSGAVIDPAPFQDLLSREELRRLPLGVRVTSDRMWVLWRRTAVAMPYVPPPLRPHGLFLASLSEITAVLEQICEERGVEVYHDMAAAEVLADNGKVTGVRLVDRGRDRNGRPRPGYEPGADVKARVVVIAEGAAGPLADRLLKQGILKPPSEMPTYALGIKELIRVPPRAENRGLCLHMLGYPLAGRASGGAFLYGLDEATFAVGLVTGLDYDNPWLDVHLLFRRLKRHPRLQHLLRDGEVIGYGAKAIPEGGLPAVPDLAGEGVVLIGDAAGLVDPIRTRGVHLAVRSGMAAAAAIADCLVDGEPSAECLSACERNLKRSREWRQAEEFRNARSWFRLGLPAAVAATSLAWISRGRLPPLLKKMAPDRRMEGGVRPPTQPFEELGPGGQKGIDLDRRSDLFYSGTEHREDQPSHIHIRDPEICRRDCLPVYGAPCTRFCPAGVYELDAESDTVRVQATDCLHCRTCRLKCPLDNIDWQVPEAGGPRYRRM